VYAYTVNAVPADVIESVETPDATVFGASVVCSAVTNLTVDEATKETIVPVSAVAASATDVPDVIWFADGTATVAGAAAVVALVTVATVTARGAAEEGATESPTIARAAAVAIEIFLNEFILFLFYYSVFSPSK
jgi:hypothetical protein